MIPYTSSIALFYFGVGDYRYIIADFPKYYFFSKRYIPIVKSEMRRLSIAQPESVNNYLNRVEHLFQHYLLDKKIESIEQSRINYLKIRKVAD